jgi:hypothetical protein
MERGWGRQIVLERGWGEADWIGEVPIAIVLV